MDVDDKTTTGRDLDKALELEEARLSERVRMRLDSHEDEDSTVIEQRAARAVKAESTPPRAKAFVAILNAVRTPGQVIVTLAFLGLLAYFVATAGPAILDRFP